MLGVRARATAFAVAVGLLLGGLGVALGGCGSEDIEKARDSVRERVADARREFRERTAELRKRVRRVLAQIDQVFPEARRTDPQVRARGRTRPGTIDAFMVDVLENIDAYWTTTFRRSGLREPSVGFQTVPPGAAVRSGCGISAGGAVAFYCPADDTIYMGQDFASNLYAGVAQGLPGESAGYGRAAGDFAVAYVLAHEYAHNLQQELGVFARRGGSQAKPFELQADCLAGSWANSVYEQGLLDPSDLDEILNTALAVGDFEVGTEQHHGRPEERRDAVLVGFESGDPAECRRFVPGL
jgi:predicted metalloprotease